MQDVLVAALLVAGMLALGTVLDRRELARRVRRPQGLVVVLAVNLLAVPALGLVMVRAVDLDPAVALGLVLATAAPGGGTGALLALHARGDVPAAVVLQVLLAAASLVVTPLWLALHAADAPGVDVAPLVVALLVLQLGPLAAGALLVAKRPAAAARLHPLARRFADMLLVALVVGLTATQSDELDRVGARALLLMAVVVAVTLATVFLPVGTPAVRRSAAMTTAVRNLSLALLAATYAPDPAVTSLAVLAYGLVMYVLAALAVLVLRRSHA